MNILVIGGTGIISTAVVQECINYKHKVFVVNRGLRKAPDSKSYVQITADVRNEPVDVIKSKISKDSFDVVIDFLSYNKTQLNKTSSLVKCGQYVFISSASIYEENSTHIYREANKKGNFGWDYCKEKFECEQELIRTANALGFKYTIIRPYITYSNKRFPYQISPVEYYTIIYRIKHQLPIPICGIDSETTITNSKDFAVALVGLLYNTKAYNEDFHITSGFTIKWTEIADLLSIQFGTSQTCCYIDIPRDFFKKHTNTTIDIPEILFDKSRNMKFDNTKLLNVLPDFKPQYADRDSLKNALSELVAFYDDTSNCKINYIWSGCLDRLIEEYTGNTKINEKAYSFENKKEKALYWTGRNPWLCAIYNEAKKIHRAIKQRN